MFADCGLGKTPMQLVWSENVVRKTNKPVLILTPLAVSYQTEREAKKFDIEASVSRDGTVKPNITITNYEKLSKFDPSDFSGIVCDESSIIKNFQGVRKTEVTEFMKKMKYRLLATATAAPNDFIELGTSSEALGELGRMDMLSRFFVNDEKSNHPVFWGARWRFKKHGEKMFWRWVASWARAIRYPSDYGFEDEGFVLPGLEVVENVLENGVYTHSSGQMSLVPIIAKGLAEERHIKNETIDDRCKFATEKVLNHERSVIWCHMNKEGDLLEKIVPDSVQVAGKHSDEQKEEAFKAFSDGEVKRIITKPKIGGFGLNWQHCNHMTYFSDHSFEKYYQSVRRCYRFGQKEKVTVDMISTQSESGIGRNLSRKSKQAQEMFTQLIKLMNDGLTIDNRTSFTKPTNLPTWL